jgi:hypothetical protein
MRWLKRLIGASSSAGSPGDSSLRRRVDVNHPLVVRSPRIGFLNLMGSPAQQIMEEDKQALQTRFAAHFESSDKAPQCDVLMLYARVKSDGSLEGSQDRFRDVVHQSGAVIAIFASENNSAQYIAATRKSETGTANIIMTHKRKGKAFPIFFSELFGRMFRGQSMLMAWVELAPQAPEVAHEHCPETVFVPEISHIVFE